MPATSPSRSDFVDREQRRPLCAFQEYLCRRVQEPLLASLPIAGAAPLRFLPVRCGTLAPSPDRPRVPETPHSRLPGSAPYRRCDTCAPPPSSRRDLPRNALPFALAVPGSLPSLPRRQCITPP